MALFTGGGDFCPGDRFAQAKNENHRLIGG